MSAPKTEKIKTAQTMDEVIDPANIEAKTQSTNSKAFKEKEIGGIKFRRTRENYDQMLTKQLDIPKEILNNELQYRWVNEENIGKYQDGFDYSIITEEHFGSKKISTRRRVGTDKNGNVQYVQLMATPKEWKHERDMARAERDKIAITEAAKGQHLSGGGLQGAEHLRKFTIETK